MNERIRQLVAELNAVWQRYEETADLATAEALNRDYLAVWEGLEACGIAEWMLVYHPATLTFSLPAPGEIVEDDCATRLLLARAASCLWGNADPKSEQVQ